MSATITTVEPPPVPAPRSSTLWPRLPRPAAAVLSGALLYASFPPRPLRWLVLPGF
ncbi:apolipoprotein N-acyltransferase, partial [Streptomyces sp. SID7834]|nr:apolipoprotein N-acyltransferase [Streptomyces sp. SID7834]